MPHSVKISLMQKFTYMRMITDHNTVIRYDGYPTKEGAVNEHDALNELGEKGWELVEVFLVGSNHVFYFKRPIE